MNLSDYLENKLIDFLFRGQAFAPPGTLYFALFTTAEGDAGGGAEVAGGSYARVAVVSSLANWAGTQGAGTVVASNGNSGLTSNNGAIVFPAPTANWGRVTHIGIFDAAAAGNLWAWGVLTAAKDVNNGDPAPQFDVAQLSLQFA